VKTAQKAGAEGTTVTPSPRRLKQEDNEFQASLEQGSHHVKPCIKTKQPHQTMTTPAKDPSCVRQVWKPFQQRPKMIAGKACTCAWVWNSTHPLLLCHLCSLDLSVHTCERRGQQS
jgi:hypothetical protein